MDLTSTFSYSGWSIKHHLFDPPNPQPSSTATLATAVFVHGTPWASDVFFPLATALLATKRFRVLLYDLPGYGRSQHLVSPTSTSTHPSKFPGNTFVAFQAETLSALLQHLHLASPHAQTHTPSPPLHIIAHDIAGTIALRAYLLHDLDYTSLCLLDTNCVLPWGDGFYKLARSQPDTFLRLPNAIFASVLRGVIRSACFDARKLEAGGWAEVLARPWLAQGDADDAEERQRSFIRQIAQANDADVAEMLDREMYSRVRCDVKIIWGAEDQWIPREKMEKLAGLLGARCKEFAVVPEAGHLVMIDQPERVAVEVFGWLLRG